MEKKKLFVIRFRGLTPGEEAYWVGENKSSKMNTYPVLTAYKTFAKQYTTREAAERGAESQNRKCTQPGVFDVVSLED